MTSAAFSLARRLRAGETVYSGWCFMPAPLVAETIAREGFAAVVLDALDAPGGGAELEGVADARLVHELLVQLAEARAVRQVHRVEPAVGDRAAGDRRHQARAARGREVVGDAVPDHARVELRRDVRRVLAGEHGERLVEGGARQRVVRVGAAHEGVQVGRRPLRLVRRDHRDDELREHVELQSPDGQKIGEVTSGLLGPSADKPVAMGYVTPEFATAGTRVNALVRGKTVPMEVAPMPFVPNRYYRG